MDPIIEQQIQAYIQRMLANGDISPGEVERVREVLYQRVVEAQTDAQVQADLAMEGIIVTPRPMEAARPGIAASLLGYALQAAGATFPPLGAAQALQRAYTALRPTPTPTPTPTLPPPTEPSYPGLEPPTEPTSGYRVENNPDGTRTIWMGNDYVIQQQVQEVDPYNPDTPKTTWQNIRTGTLDEEASAITEADIEAYEAMLGRPLSAYERSRLILGFTQPAGESTALTPYQSGQLSLGWAQEERMRQAEEAQAERYRQEAERAKLETAIQAARTGNPLTYLALQRGAVPGAGGTDIYQGVRPVTQSVLTPALEAYYGGGAWEAPELPPAMAAQQAGRPAQPLSLPQGTFRPLSPQAQARLSPYTQEAIGETVEFQGVPRMDWEAYLAKTKRAMGGGLTLPRYSGVAVAR